MDLRKPCNNSNTLHQLMADDSITSSSHPTMKESITTSNNRKPSKPATPQLQKPSDTLFRESSPSLTQHQPHSHSRSHSQQQQNSVVSTFLNSHITDEAMKPTKQTSTNSHKYCYRHNPNIRCNKSHDEVKMNDIQNQLEKLPRFDQEALSHVWSIFSAAPNQHRILLLQGLLTQCCFPQLSMISQEVSKLIKIDFIEILPSELSLKILRYLDCQSLCNAAQVSTKWKQLADDDRVWKYMCEQHIDRKCPKCGWGLPLMAVKKQQERIALSTKCKKRKIQELSDIEDSPENLPPKLDDCFKISEEKCKQQQIMRKRARPWKSVYSERYKVERNWRKGIYTIKCFQGHSDGVLCCQYDNAKLLMTGSYDKTIKIWNVETGELLRTLYGHSRGVKCLAFDDQKLITGGLDSTIKVWNYRTGECISSYPGHQEAVTAVDFYDKTIVSGSADRTIKVWHVESRTCYTLRGHTEWVTCVKINPESNTIFSAGEDSTIRIWDLETNECLRVLGGAENNGHIGQIQSIVPFSVKDTLVTDIDDNSVSSPTNDDEHEQSDQEETHEDEEQEILDIPGLPTHLLSASLDNTIKLWDIRTGKCIRTQFGHIEGVWSIAADTFRIVSGSHDKTIKVWDLQTGKCMHTFVGNASSVSCVALGDSRFVCGLDNGEVKMYCFDTPGSPNNYR